jgi:outer membrane protein TolC
MNFMGIEPNERRTIIGVLEVENVLGNRDESLSHATEFRSDLKQLQEQLKLQGNQLLIEKSGLMPKLTLTGSGGWNHPNSRRNITDNTWTTQLNISIPIFDRSVTRSNLITAKATLEQDKIALEQKELDIKSEIETAWTSITTASSSLKASEKALELAEESLRLAQVGYEEGVTPQIDLLTAQTALTSAKLNYANAQYNHLMTIVALKVTEGTIVRWSGEKNFK